MAIETLEALWCRVAFQAVRGWRGGKIVVWPDWFFLLYSEHYALTEIQSSTLLASPIRVSVSGDKSRGDLVFFKPANRVVFFWIATRPTGVRNDGGFLLCAVQKRLWFACLPVPRGFSTLRGWRGGKFVV